MKEIDPPAIVRGTEDFIFVGREIRAEHQAYKAGQQKIKRLIRGAKEQIQEAKEVKLENRKRALNVGKWLLEVYLELKKSRRWGQWLRDIPQISRVAAYRYMEWAKYLCSTTVPVEQIDLLSEETDKEWRRICGKGPKPGKQDTEGVVESSTIEDPSTLSVTVETQKGTQQQEGLVDQAKEGYLHCKHCNTYVDPELGDGIWQCPLCGSSLAPYEDNNGKYHDESSKEGDDRKVEDVQIGYASIGSSVPVGLPIVGAEPLTPGNTANTTAATTDNRGKAGKKGGFILLDDWKNLGMDWQRNFLFMKGDSKFNKQEEEDSTKQGNIEWALWSWNPVTGCKHDCPYCYARDIANRLFEPKFEPVLWPNRLRAPHNTPLPDKAAVWMGYKNVFVCSMADLFGRWVPREWIDAVLNECASCPEWNFLFLTKFPNRMSEFEFSDNCWVGTTVDCQARVKNAEKSFRKVKAKFKWLSCEPMIEPLHFTDIGAFQWIVIGGASRSTQTPEWHPPREWVVNLEAEAWKNNCAVYEKTNLYPCDVGEARIRQYPGIEREVIKPPDSMIYLPQEIG